MTSPLRFPDPCQATDWPLGAASSTLYSVSSARARSEVGALVADGLVDGRAALGRGDVPGARVLLTRRGRLLADAVVRTLAD